MKKLLLGALAFLGFATQAVAVPFVEGQAYLLKHNASGLYFNMEVTGLGDGHGTYMCASLQAEVDASKVYFVQNPDNENQWQIHLNSADGPYLSSNSNWNSIINGDDGYYWNVTENDDNTVVFSRTQYATNGNDNYLGPNVGSYGANTVLWTNQDGSNSSKYDACKFVVESATVKCAVTLVVNHGGVKLTEVNLGMVQSGESYSVPEYDSTVLTITGWNNGDVVTGEITLTANLAEGVKPFKLNNLRYADQWATTSSSGLMRAATTYAAGEYLIEVPVADSGNFKIYSINQLSWVGAAGKDVKQVTFSETPGEFQLLKHSCGAEAIGNAGAASTQQVFFNTRDNGIGTWSAGNDAGSHWFMVYDNEAYAANREYLTFTLGGWGDVTSSNFGTAVADAEAAYAEVENVTGISDEFEAAKEALKNAIEVAKNARYGVAGVNIAEIVAQMNAAVETARAEKNNVKVQLAVLVDEAKSQLTAKCANNTPGYYDITGSYYTAVSAGISTAENALSAFLEDYESEEAYTAALTDAMNGLSQALETADEVVLSGEFTGVYTITNKDGNGSRGYLCYVEAIEENYVWASTKVKTGENNEGVDVVIPDLDTDASKWAFVEKDGELLMFNVGAKMFIRPTGTGARDGWVFHKDKAAPITLAPAEPGIGTVEISSLLDNVNYNMSISTYYGTPVGGYYATGDGGVPFVFARVGELDDELKAEMQAMSPTTAIEEIEVANPAQQGIYDLQGRKLSAPVKGINIINGKKVLVK